MMPEKKTSTLLMALLLIIGCGLFAFSVQLRSPYYPTHTIRHHLFDTYSSLSSAVAWYREGLVNLHFALFREQASIEFDGLKDLNLGLQEGSLEDKTHPPTGRYCYLSYPPGSILPVYLASQVAGREPTLEFVMGFSMGCHLVFSLLLAFLVFYFLRLRLGFSDGLAFGFSLLPLMLGLFLPAPMYWFHHYYFAENSVLILYLLSLLLEVLRDARPPENRSRVLAYLQGVILFYGFLTDWLFVFYSLALFAKRTFGEKNQGGVSAFFGRAVRFWFPAALALAIYLGICISIMGFDQFVSFLVFKIVRRSGSGEGIPITISEFSRVFWGDHILENYGRVFLYILAASAVVAVFLSLMTWIKKQLKRPLNSGVSSIIWLVFLIVIPCIAQIYTFKGLAYFHDFTTLKMTLSLALVPFVLLPVWGVLLFSKSETGLSSRRVLMSLLVIFLLVVPGLLYRVQGWTKGLFPEPNYASEVFSCDLAAWIRKKATFNDVLFSPQISISYPIHDCLALKNVYLVKTMEEVDQRMSGLKKEAQPAILLFRRKTHNGIVSDLTPTIERAVQGLEEESTLMPALVPDEIPNWEGFVRQLKTEGEGDAPTLGKKLWDRLAPALREDDPVPIGWTLLLLS